MIPKEYTTESLAGKYARTLVAYDSENGHSPFLLRDAAAHASREGSVQISSGTLVLIESPAGKGKLRNMVCVKTLPCPHCGQFSVIHRVRRDDLELADAPVPTEKHTALAGKPIARNTNSDTLAGKACRVVRKLQNGGGHGVSPWTTCRIIDAHYGVTIEAGKCEHCGRSAYIAQINRKDVLLLNEKE